MNQYARNIDNRWDAVKRALTHFEGRGWVKDYTITTPDGRPSRRCEVWGPGYQALYGLGEVEAFCTAMAAADRSIGGEVIETFGS